MGSEEVPGAVRDAIRALRPLALWYLALSVSVVVFGWEYSTRSWTTWPTPFRWAAWAWFVATVTIPPYVLVENVWHALRAIVRQAWLEHEAQAALALLEKTPKDPPDERVADPPREPKEAAATN